VSTAALAFTWLKRFVSIVATLLVTFSGSGVRTEAHPGNSQIIDRHGRPISSIYQGLSPNLRFAREYNSEARAKRRLPPQSEIRRSALQRSAEFNSCSFLQASFHDSKHIGRFLNAQLTDCSGHRAVSEFRNCTQSCGGGQYEWTYIDPYGDYLQGYLIQGDGCGGCTLDESTCFNGNIH
jgi:hypothetical protein